MVDPEALVREFQQTFDECPRVYRAPGRANLIGEHTDYTDGFALPIALDRATWVAAAPRRDRKLVTVSRAFRETFTIDLDDQPAHPTESWIDYVRGVAAVLAPPVGANLLIDSDVPIGAGMSSSAALEIACGYALLDVSGRDVDRAALARAGQRAEHVYVGTQCGLMDQMTACYGRAGHALLLDTRTFEYRYFPMPPSICVVVGNTMVRHALASGEYNARRADCEEGTAIVVRRFPAARALRDVSLGQLEELRSGMSERVYRRCRHVVTENGRTLDAVDALVAGRFGTVGRLMNSSHTSLQRDYEVSCPELDTMAGIARSLPGVLGARMMGGGFGGSIIALVDASCASSVEDAIRRDYASATRHEPDVWTCHAGDGVERIDDRLSAPAI